MTLFKYWQRVQFSNSPAEPLDSTPFLVASSEAVSRVDDTFLRAIAWPRVTVSVHKTSFEPPEQWWMRTYFEYIMFIDQGGTPTIPFPESGDKRIVFSAMLQPTYTASALTPLDYYVTFEPPKLGFQTHGMRKGSAPSTFPKYWTALNVIDPLVALTATHSGMQINVDSYDVVEWGTISL
jgi:hypothetical protein